MGSALDGPPSAQSTGFPQFFWSTVDTALAQCRRVEKNPGKSIHETALSNALYLEVAGRTRDGHGSHRSGGLMVWFAICIAVVGLATAGWYRGLIGHSSVLSAPRARRRLRRVTDDVLSRYAEVHASVPTPAAARGPSDTPPTPGSSRTQTEINYARPTSLLDVLVPGGLAFAGGAIDWLTPDQAALDAVAHVTGEDVTSALDLHATLAERHYQLWADGSMMHWRGHVGEAQIAEQVESWSAPGAVDMPEAANHPGADLTIFGQDFQAKFVEDFNSIDNVHGDALIVADDTANVPDDALHVDFSEPFDPALLEGHDVIVAEGLTLAGSEEAWETAAGLAAGGLDGGDAADMAEFAVIPGVGTAIRVAVSGYRRRIALADPDLRDRAMGRVARDAGYAAAGAGSVGMIGHAIGGIIDVASGGLTGGAGFWLLGAIGAALGGKTAADIARGEDNEKITVEREHVKGALAAYGLAVDATQERAALAWTEAVSQADRLAAQRAERRCRELEAVGRMARLELVLLQRLDPAEVCIALDEVSHAVDQLYLTARSPRSRIRIEAWRNDRTKLVTEALDGTADVEALLLLLVALPAGDRWVATWLKERLDRRATVLATAESLMSGIQIAAVRDRLELAKSLTGRREELRQQINDDLAQPVIDLELSNKRLKDELKLTGRG